MSRIDPDRHPLLHLVSQEARWKGRDQYPSSTELADEHERWLHLAHAKGAFDHYLGRFRGSPRQRDEALAEMGAAYFLSSRCGLEIVSWEPVGLGGKRGEFVVSFPPARRLFVEVKSPGWEAEIVQSHGAGSQRLKEPKYLDGEVRWIGPWEAVRRAVAKAYGKMPEDMPTLLIIWDDLFVPLGDLPDAVDIALYCPRARGCTSGYLAEDGCFVGRQYDRLGAVGIMDMNIRRGRPEYRFSLFRNANAVQAVALPPWPFAGFATFDGGEPGFSPGRLDGVRRSP